jgi:mono/diheme cytochrome c family protein
MAARLYPRALRLQEAGRAYEAFALTTQALASLPAPGAHASDPTVGLRLAVTVLHVELAEHCGECHSDRLGILPMDS